MENPWLKLTCDPPYVLDLDREGIETFDAHNAPIHQVDISLLPEPFIGSPSSAKVVLLNLNPGWDPDDATAHADPDFRKAICRNLRHEQQGYPFYPLNPKFSWTPCAKWWLRKTGKLIATCGLDKVASGLLVIEWFPYHSQKAHFPQALICDSQRYSCQLAKDMSEKGVTMALLRAPNQWGICSDEFPTLPSPNSWQNPAITANNFGPSAFNEMTERLCAAEVQAPIV